MTGSFDRIADVYDETRRMPPEVLGGIIDNVRSEVDPSGGPPSTMVKFRRKFKMFSARF